MKLQFNWNKIFLNIYPDDIMKQFKKVFLPFYFLLGFILAFTILNQNDIFFKNQLTLSEVMAWTIVFPILLPFTLLGVIFSSTHIIRKNNPFFLFYVSFKSLFVYMFSLVMLVFSSMAFLIFLIALFKVLHLI